MSKSWRSFRFLRQAAESLLVVVILGSYIGAFWAAYSSGVTWDEKFHVSQIEKVIAKKPFTDVYGEEWESLKLNDLDYVYGLTYQQLGHVVNVVRGNETWQTVSTDAEAYAVRHFVGVFLSLLAGVAVFLSSWVLTKSRLVALFAWGLLASWPTWLGHSFMNPKDLPAAAGWTVFSAGLVVFLWRRRLVNAERFHSRIYWWLSWAAVALGFYLAVGSRIAFWLPLLLIGLVTVFISFTPNRTIRSSALASSRASLIVNFLPLTGIAAGFLVFLLTHWHLTDEMSKVFLSSLRTSASFDLAVFVLTNGQLIEVADPMPRSYLPLWFWATSASLLGILLAFGVVSYVRSLFSWMVSLRSIPRTEESASGPKLDLMAMTPFALQGSLLPIGVVLLGSPTWDGVRHHLYAIPAIALVAAIGAYSVYKLSRRTLKSVNRSILGLLSFLLPVGIIVEHVIYDVGLFPYNYVYVNYLATLNREPNKTWETDYWGLSVREALAGVPAGAPIDVWGVSASYEPFAHIRGAKLGVPVDDDSFYWVRTQRNGVEYELPGDCIVTVQIERAVLDKQFTMARVYKCTK